MREPGGAGGHEAFHGIQRNRTETGVHERKLSGQLDRILGKVDLLHQKRKDFIRRYPSDLILLAAVEQTNPCDFFDRIYSVAMRKTKRFPHGKMTKSK